MCVFQYSHFDIKYSQTATEASGSAAVRSNALIYMELPLKVAVWVASLHNRDVHRTASLPPRWFRDHGLKLNTFSGWRKHSKGRNLLVVLELHVFTCRATWLHCQQNVSDTWPIRNSFYFWQMYFSGLTDIFHWRY